MSEFLVIQVGQCGNQIGSSLWPSILDEYNINLVANADVKGAAKSTKKYSEQIGNSFRSFFDIPDGGKSGEGHSFSTLSDLEMNEVKARVICIDMEESVVSRFPNSELKFLFDKKGLITNNTGSGNNWAEGYFTHGIKFKNKIMKAITRHIEKCDGLKGFLLIYSMGGGTGSGLGSYILKLLEDYYPHIERIVACVYPTGSEDVITAPLNMMLATQYLIQHATCVFPVENRALQEIANRQKFSGINNCKAIANTFDDMNSIVVKLLLHVTSGSRFSGQLNLDINEINTNMVPFPKMNFLSSSVSPFDDGKYTRVSRSLTREDNFWNTCKTSHQMLKIDPMDSRSALLAGMLLGRGDYTLSDMKRYVDKLKTRAPFLDWSRRCIRVGLCAVPPHGFDFSMLTLFNTSAITDLFDCLSLQYQKILKRKAHIHHYTKVPGFELDNFEQCQDIVADITKCYSEIRTSVSPVIPRLQPTINY